MFNSSHSVRMLQQHRSWCQAQWPRAVCDSQLTCEMGLFQEVAQAWQMTDVSLWLIIHVSCCELQVCTGSPLQPSPYFSSHTGQNITDTNLCVSYLNQKPLFIPVMDRGFGGGQSPVSSCELVLKGAVTCWL